MAQYENKGDRLNILLADELPKDMTGKQDTQHICGKCAWYSFAKLESICRRTDKEVAYFANKECFTTDKDMEENNNAQPVAESTGTQVCKECGRTLPLDDFQRRRNGNVDNACKACRAEKARIGIARKKAVKVENPDLVVTSEEVANAKRVEIAQLSRYLTDFKMAGLALWGMMPGKEEGIDQIIKAEWTVPFCREIFAAAAELKRDEANVVPALVANRLGGVGQMFVEDLGNSFYPLAKECDTSEQKPAESGDERIRQFLLRLAKRCSENSIDFIGEIKKGDVIAYLEKQKEQKPELPLMGGDTDTYFDDLRMTTKPLTSREWFDEGIKYAQRLQKEQHPSSKFRSDAALLDELRRRGYKGRISKCEEVEI